MSKVNTLKKNREFNYVYRKGKAFSGNFLVLICLKRKFGPVRAGFSVSKKVGKAVVRNKVRRRLKEAFALKRPQIKGSYYLIFVARPAIASAKFTEIQSCMNYLSTRAHMLDT